MPAGRPGQFVATFSILLAQASPPVLCPRGRTRDLDALLTELGHAREFIYVSVMEYFPTTRFRHPARCGGTLQWGGAAARGGAWDLCLWWGLMRSRTCN